MTKRTPKWLADKIEDSRRAATPGICPKCGKDVIRGQSDDAMFWKATVDPFPVDAITEAMARAAGRHTYDAIPRQRETWLYVRAIEHMQHKPIYPVLVDHACDLTGATDAEFVTQTAVPAPPEGLF